MRFYDVLQLLCLPCAIAQQQETAQPPAPSAPPAQADVTVEQYIRNGWAPLTRSMTDCATVHDPKLAGASVVYLPHGYAIPSAVAALRSKCNVRVEHLPHAIAKEGDLMPSELKTPGLLYLPHRYVVPGGRFNEMYGWDSYFILLGLLSEGHEALARGIVENFFFEIENYGAILNANRTYYLTRSQPPFLARMVDEVYRTMNRRDPDAAKTWLEKAMPYLERDHALWMSDAHKAGDTGLARYFDLGSGPVPEMEDDSTYYVDVIKWLLAHPEVKTNYLTQATDGQACASGASAVCAHTEYQGWRLTPAFYRSDRAMRESGFDVSFRFGPFSGSTENYAPVCLNALLYRYEIDVAGLYTKLGDDAKAKQWTDAAEARKTAMNRYLWDARTGAFADYDFVYHRRSTYLYATAAYPLWAGLATRTQAASTMRQLRTLSHDGGLAMSNTTSGMQWDAPFGWAPVNWIAVDGMSCYGYGATVGRIAHGFMHSIRENYERDGTLREKYNVVDPQKDVEVAAGYKSNVIGFGWTNAVYLKMNGLLFTGRSSDCASTVPARSTTLQ
jgi:alpha,alpha-trehalase